LRNSYAVLQALLLAGVTLTVRAEVHSPSATNADLVSVVRMSLDIVERRCGINTLVLPEHADTKLVDALAELHRTVIDHNEIPYSPRDTLPSGYIQLISVSIAGNHAQFKATLGPVGRGMGHKEAWTCGTTFTIPLNKVHGTWIAGQGNYMVC
jgi:hypothetical protein